MVQNKFPRWIIAFEEPPGKFAGECSKGKSCRYVREDIMQKLIDKMEECLKFVEHVNNCAYVDLGDMQFEDDLRFLLYQIKRGEM